MLALISSDFPNLQPFFTTHLLQETRVVTVIIRSDMILYKALFRAGRRAVRRDFMVEDSVFTCSSEMGVRVADHAPGLGVSAVLDVSEGTCHP
jgi:hypothetical protein